MPIGCPTLYRMRRSGLAPVAAQLAAPVALGMLIGGVLAYQAGTSVNAVHPVPLGAVATPTPSFGKPSAPATAQAATTSTDGNCGILVLADPFGAPRLGAPYQVTDYQVTDGKTSAESACA